MKTASSLSLKRWLLAKAARSSLCAAGHFFGFLIKPNRSAISIRLRISSRKTEVETFLGKLGNKGLGCMANTLKNYCLYFKQSHFFCTDTAIKTYFANQITSLLMGFTRFKQRLKN
jgi:hypothetical protein